MIQNANPRRGINLLRFHQKLSPKEKLERAMLRKKNRIPKKLTPNLNPQKKVHQEGNRIALPNINEIRNQQFDENMKPFFQKAKELGYNGGSFVEALAHLGYSKIGAKLTLARMYTNLGIDAGQARINADISVEEQYPRIIKRK
jgi:hypothetical protein